MNTNKLIEPGRSVELGATGWAMLHRLLTRLYSADLPLTAAARLDVAHSLEAAMHGAKPVELLPPEEMLLIAGPDGSTQVAPASPWKAVFATPAYGARGLGRRQTASGKMGYLRLHYTTEVQEIQERCRVVNVEHYEIKDGNQSLHRWRQETVVPESEKLKYAQAIHLAESIRAQWLECEAENLDDRLEEQRIENLYEAGQHNCASFAEFRNQYYANCRADKASQAVVAA